MKLRPIVILFVIMGLLFLLKINGFAMSYEQEYYDMYLNQDTFLDMDENLYRIQREYNSSCEISFEEIIRCMLNGEIDRAITIIFQGLYDGMLGEVLLNKELMLKILLLVIVAAVFKNYSSILKNGYVGEQGFYITYLLLTVILIQAFSVLYDISEETIHYITDLMKCMLPALYLSLTLCAGITTSQVMNSMFLTMLTFLESLLLKFVLPGIQIYFFIAILNPLNKEDRFSKLAALVKQGIGFVLKTIVTLIFGLNVVKGMLVPVYENARYQVLQKGLSFIPGGAALTGISSILVGAGMLIKNSVGVTVAMLLLVFSAIPVLKLFLVYIMYKLMIAMIQPVSDKRILTGIQGISDSIGLLLRATYTSVVLSILSIAIMILTTNYH